ncbi:uncharacterized protein LOC125803858 isoform X1 [Astyanax mexicanus]|uniref:uncharacterized protein LOC125803858 isoform X1 n=1 Tax=Astyanax mexicanus TaxID=7994 RepID=UPI0020CAA2E8|nr:uncharacterized protein LOC125803858 isoform X1 [Astyanax mexicanus]XP_049338298.1 uncharacterized protein LOC125803858 isoform X1 [Astyanax mexicanus]
MSRKRCDNCFNIEAKRCKIRQESEYVPITSDHLTCECVSDTELTLNLQHDHFHQLNQSLDRLRNECNPSVIDAVNRLNESLALTPDLNNVTEQSVTTPQNVTQESNIDLFHNLNQSLDRLRNECNPSLLDAVNRLNESLALTPDRNNVTEQSVTTAQNVTQEPMVDLFHNLNQSLDRLRNEADNENQHSHTLSSGSNQAFSVTVHNNENVQDQIGYGVEGEIPQDIHVNRIDRFNTTEIRRPLNFSSLGNVESFDEFYNYVMEVFNQTVEVANGYIGPKDSVYVEIQGDSLNVSASVEVIDGVINPNDIVTMIEQSMQSKFEILSDETLQIVIRIVHPPRGGARVKFSQMFNSEIVRNKLKHLFDFQNKDNLCFALCVSKLLNPDLNDYQVEHIAKRLQADVGMSENDAVSFADISLFEKLLDCKIVVMYRDAVKKGYSFFQNSTIPHEKTLFLFLHENHYYGVKNLKAVLGTGYVCSHCYAGYNDENHHKCEYRCNVCQDNDCPKLPKNTVQCQDCLRLCRTPYCYEKHKVKDDSGKNLCETRFYCAQCNTVQHGRKGTSKHSCRANLCRQCGAKVNPEFEHECFITPLEKEKNNKKYIFYDFETNQESGNHIANFICCSTFKGKVWTAEGPDCVSAFFKRYRRKKYKGYTFLAHNARSYDSYILLNHLVREGINPDIIAQGGKILCFEDVEFRQRFIDSLSFLPMKLSAIPKAMGFKNEKKGYFPHFWNTLENQNYIGPYPAAKYYGVDTMMDKERQEFFEWYNTLSGKVFDLRKELADYCVNDVHILRKGCLAFREQIMSGTGVDPFKCITIASVCLKIFRTHFLTDNTLAIPPHDDYISRQKSFSNSAIQWLEYLSDRGKIPIRHALNEGEVQMGQYFLDGYFTDGHTQNAFEFLGCFFHGCDKCFPANARHPLSKIGQTFEDVKQHSLQKIKNLQNIYNMHVTTIWEHEWNEMKRTDQDVIAFLKRFDFPERLKPRQALFGGRTNALHLHYVAQPGERIDYYDFTSLYPYVNKTKNYPVGHPTIIFRDFEPLENYFGLFRIKILPPRGLWAPVLPYRVKNKLLFPLCRVCAELQQQQCCKHADEERALTGSWCSVEVMKALEKGYRVLKVFEIWHFPKQTHDLFAGYINRFLKTKQESSGYPSWVKDESDQKEYVKRYKENEGIELDPSRIEVNQAKRSVAKLALNSLWGKMCQRSDRINTCLISDPNQFLEFMFSDTYDVSHFSFPNRQMALVQWRYADTRFIKPSKANVFIGIFTTAYARLELYKLIDGLQQRCLYTDTDSVIFKSKDGDWMPPLGDYLGELTSELDHGDHIVEFVSSGPKSYGYRTRYGKTVMKVKGITLNYTNAKIVNLSSLIDLVDKSVKSPDCTDEIMTSNNQIVRDKRGFHLKNKSQTKRFRVVYDKRVLLPDSATIPYGY